MVRRRSRRREYIAHSIDEGIPSGHNAYRVSRRDFRVQFRECRRPSRQHRRWRVGNSCSSRGRHCGERRRYAGVSFGSLASRRPRHTNSDLCERCTTNLTIDIRNAGSAYWPTARELGTHVGAVEIALRWHRRDKSKSLVADNRWPLVISLFPGDHTRIKVPLAPTDLDGNALRPGNYDVRIGMIREGVADSRTTEMCLCLSPW